DILPSNVCQALLDPFNSPYSSRTPEVIEPIVVEIAELTKLAPKTCLKIEPTLLPAFPKPPKTDLSLPTSPSACLPSKIALIVTLPSAIQSPPNIQHLQARHILSSDASFVLCTFDYRLFALSKSEFLSLQ